MGASDEVRVLEAGAVVVEEAPDVPVVARAQMERLAADGFGVLQEKPVVGDRRRPRDSRVLGEARVRLRGRAGTRGR